MKRITAVGYAINGSGLGHLTRTLAILRWARRLAWLAGHEFDAYVLTSSEGCSLAYEEGFAAFKIPSKTAVRDARIPKQGYLRLARQWVWHSLGLVDPDLLIVDTFPGGSFGELLHALDGPRRRVFVHRAMRDGFARAEGVQALLPLYDRILVPVEPGSDSQWVDPALEPRTRRIGPILLRSREELHDRAAARRRLGVPDGKLAAWVTAGGGGDPSAAASIGAIVGRLAREPDLHVVVGAGPLYRGEPLRGPNVTWLQSHRAVEEFAGLDFAISAAGYNAFHELLHAGVPSAFFAQEKIADEQSRRVGAAERAGCALGLGTDAAGAPSPEALDAALAAFRDARSRAALSAAAEAFVPASFARDAAAEALEGLVPAEALDEAMEAGTPPFFVGLERAGVPLDVALKALAVLGRAPDLDAEERASLLLRAIERAGDAAPAVVRLFPAIAGRLGPPAGADEAEELVAAAAHVAVAALEVGDERAAASFLRMLPSSRAASPRALARAAVDFLEALASRGDSLWRGLSVLDRHLGAVGAEADAVAALEAAAREVRATSVGERSTP